MTCREFMDAAELLTPAQLLRLQPGDQPLGGHAQECASCGRWLESHRHLGNAFSALSAETAPRGASPAVEAAVLQAFRERGFAPRVIEMPKPAPKAIWGLSRFFEVGAYAAVAAALIVGLFLGARLLNERQTGRPAEQAKVVAPVVTAQPADRVIENSADKQTHTAVEVGVTQTATKGATVAVKKSSATESDRSDYVATMLCDPIICSGDEQVVRMEIPASNTATGNSAQTVLADVVIGEDGLVRAMRIVNE